MFDWLLVVLTAFGQHDEGYHYERCSRCCCGDDHGECLVAGVCEALGRGRSLGLCLGVGAVV